MAELVRLDQGVLGGFQRRIPGAANSDRQADLFAELDRRQRAAGLIFAGPRTVLYRLVGGDVEVTLGVPMDEALAGFDAIGMPGGRALMHRHRGPFSGLAEVHSALSKEADDLDLECTGLTREVYRLIARDPKQNVCDVYLDVAED